MENNDLELNTLLSLSTEELEKIFSEFSLSEIEDLLNKLNEVGYDE